MPPPRPISTSPARMAWSSNRVERRPEAHTLLIVSDETSLGIPPLICAWREGICPWPACSTWPMITCSTCSGSTPARSSAAAIAVPPSSVASSEESTPPSLPTGVRAVERITVSGMAGKCSVRTCVDIQSTTRNPPETDADCVVVGVFEGEDVAHDTPGGELQALLESGEARRGFRKLAVTHAGGKRWVLIGLGKRDEFDPERARVAAAVAYGRAGELGAKTLCWEGPHHAGDAGVARLREGTLRRDSRFARFKSGAKDENRRIGALLVSAHHDVAEPVRRAVVVANAQNDARDLQNTPANAMTPTALADRARGLGDALDSHTVDVEGREGIVARGMGAFAAVAQGSDEDPQLIVLR